MAKGPEQKEDAIRSKMVGWYDPGQLAVTGLQTVLSSMFAQRADYRLIEALQPPPDPESYVEHDELWIDYVADVGDGFNSTYAVACALARSELPDEEGAALPRGQLLIMGGDEVYPTPTAAGYKERLVAPYTLALAPVGEAYQPVLYAIPGNHDWYDGLGSFMNLFCQGHDIGAWKTKQKRSYFALKLAHRTWLFGVDIQLDSDIDNPQIDYFMNLDIQVGDRILLCTAEPDWIYGNIYDVKKNLSVFEGKLLQKGAKIILQLAGDLHHYRRHTLVGAGDVHLVTAGGGGAFLHPTHTHDVDVVKVGEANEKGVTAYALNKETEYPSRAISRWLGLRNIPFFIYNPWFGIVPGAIYTVLSWVMPPSVPAAGSPFDRLSSAISHGLHEIAEHPSGLVWVVAVLLGFVVFTDTHKPFYKWLGGLTHGAAHLAGALGVSMVAGHLVAQVSEDLVIQRLLGSLLIFIGGYLVGSLLMGLYLAISVCVFRRHGNEAFSALRIEGYKNFLRMRLDASGVTVWAFALDRVPGDGQWRDVRGKDGHRRPEPTADAPKIEPRVIDHFFIPRAPSPKKKARKKDLG